MKRYVALFFIILTNAILFAHAIVPHHHHGMIIVWHLHGTTEKAPHTEDTTPCPCQQQEKQDTEPSCLLNQPVILPSTHNFAIFSPSFEIPNPLHIEYQPLIEEIELSSFYNQNILKIPDRNQKPMVRGWSTLAPPIC